MALQNQEIAGRIRELRGRRPQTVVAEALGVAERTYQNWEAGDAKPNYRSLQRLAEYYGVGEDYILTGLGNSTPVDNGTPDLFAGGSGSVEDRLEQLADQLAQDRSERGTNITDMKALIAEQSRALREQAAVLGELRDAVRELTETVATQRETARRLEEMTQAAVDAMPVPAAGRAPRKAPTGTSQGS